MKIRLTAVVLIALAQLSGCGGGGGGGGPSVPTYTIGGTIANLTGSGLVLQLNGGGNVPVNANATAFTFITQLAAGAMYNVSVLTQPTGPIQTCNVVSGSGTVGAANVTSVGVFCGGFTIGSLADPLAVEQWHLKNTGQKAFADTAGVPGMDINVEPVYSTFGFTGNGVITAVVDTGLEIAHEDLAANVIPAGSWNFLVPANDPNATDPTNTLDTDGDHGTSVGGLIAMVRNSVGGIGVAPRASLKGFNFLSSDQTEQK